MGPLVALCGARLGAGRAGRNPMVGAGANYVDALVRAGAEVAVLAPRPIGPDAADALIARVDGLVLAGGPDVDPARYGQAPHPATYGVDAGRDAFEEALLGAAMRARRPVLAICRGCQVLNVALGGSLHQHLGDRPGTASHAVAVEPGQPLAVGHLHAVTVEPASRLAAALAGQRRVTGSSLHHQAVDRVGTGLVVTARADDGVVEAIERTEGWVVGVQWHPEDTAATDATQQHLFDAFVGRCADGGCPR